MISTRFSGVSGLTGNLQPRFTGLKMWSESDSTKEEERPAPSSSSTPPQQPRRPTLHREGAFRVEPDRVETIIHDPVPQRARRQNAFRLQEHGRDELELSSRQTRLPLAEDVNTPVEEDPSLRDAFVSWARSLAPRGWERSSAPSPDSMRERHVHFDETIFDRRSGSETEVDGPEEGDTFIPEECASGQDSRDTSLRLRDRELEYEALLLYALRARREHYLQESEDDDLYHKRRGAPDSDSRENG